MHLSRRAFALLDGVAVGADPVSRLSPFALARMALRAAREGRKDVGLWRAVAARAVTVAPTMQPADMSTVLFAFARMRYRDKVMMARLAESTPAILGSFRAADITYFLAAFARLDVQHKLVFNLFAREIARKLYDFNAAQLGELVYAYSRLGMRHDLLLDVLKKRLIEVVKALRPWHLAMVVNGFARLDVVDERFFTVLASEISRKIPDFSGRPLALVANAYAKLNVRNQFLLEVLGDEVFRRRGELEPQSVALTLNAYARLRVANPVLFDYFVQDVPRRIRSFNMQSVCLVASAYAKQRRAEPALFAKLGDFACERAQSLYPRALATLLFSFSEVGIRHGLLFYHSPEHVTKNVLAYSLDELAMCACAYGRFQMVHLRLFDTITSALQSRAIVPNVGASERPGEEDPFQDEPAPVGPTELLPRVSSLVWFLEAYARLTIYEADVLQTLCDGLAKRSEELRPPLLVQATRAAAALAYAHPGLVEMASACLAAEGAGDLAVEDLEMLAKALEDLGAASELSPEDHSALLLERPRPSESGLGLTGSSGS